MIQLNTSSCPPYMTICIIKMQEARQFLKRHLHKSCMELCSHSCSVLKELALMMKTMKRSSKLDFSIGEMNFAVQELQDALRSLPSNLQPPMLTTADANNEKPGTDVGCLSPPLLEVLPLVTLVSLLIETAARIEDLSDGVVELSEKAKFKPPKEDKPKQDLTTKHHTIEIPSSI